MRIVTSIKKNKVFKFISSIKLAVPLMLVVLLVSAAGTIIESRYNPQVAAIMIYRSPWFLVLLALLWINIFSAAFSRIPFKKNHTGFVITHIGLLTLLSGAMLTSLYGIDGELRVEEGSTENRVLESSLVLQIKDVETGNTQALPIERGLKRINTPRIVIPGKVNIETVEPFVAYGESYVGITPVNNADENLKALQFTLKSAFFDFSDWLDSENRTELNLGPALIKFANSKKEILEKKSEQIVSRKLKIYSSPQRELLADVDLSTLNNSSIEIGDTVIKVRKEYLYAVVRNGKLIDKIAASSGVQKNYKKAQNPAIELEIQKDGKRLREFAFAAFPEFTVNPKEKTGLEFHYEFLIAGAQEGRKPANEIVFVPAHESKVDIYFMKNGETVSKKQVIAGETVEAPWMGIRLTIGRYFQNAAKVDVVSPIALPKREALPPSAIRLSGVEGLNTFGGAWLVEGDYKTVTVDGKKYDFYYGMKPILLPFFIHLKDFIKSDYPGTAMALNYQSSVAVSGLNEDRLIDMNNPLKHGGYYFYQASYLIREGLADMTILSVNRDPGRPFKYIGSIILCLGIVIFTVMRSSWWRRRFTIAGLMLLFPLFYAQNTMASCLPGSFIDQIDSQTLKALPLQSNGRVKPFETLAREAILFIHGRYTLKTECVDEKIVINDPVKSYFAIMQLATLDKGVNVPIIEVRSPELRQKLGLKSDNRFASLGELQNAGVEALSRPLLQKEVQNSRSLTPAEKDTLELHRQMQLTSQIVTGEHLLLSMQYTLEASDQSKLQTVQAKMMDLLKLLFSSGDKNKEPAFEKTKELSVAVHGLKFEPMLERFKNNIPFELSYNKTRPFFWASILFICLGFSFIFLKFKKHIILTSLLPLAMLLFGIILRIKITGFSPVTNMFGTMIWVSFGAAVFSIGLFKLYKNKTILGLVFITSGLALLFTHYSPLMLSPDMDPIVAVLRSNFWLSTHVLTITISYAAFTIAMVVGNAALIKKTFGSISEHAIKDYAHFAYRMIQLGVFLLTTGIILGGVWADYSWGRFWGWDPKETWALIADLGYLAILHARHTGWVDSIGLLMWSPIAYLLVIMAWYGVNFILATGLHSYGFSSGGTAFVVTFVATQLLIVIIARMRSIKIR